MNPAIQLNLYNNAPLPLAPPIPPAVPIPSNKHPWEMSEEEFDAYEETLAYYKRPGVSPRDNPFEEPLYGQEAVVYLALVANETVPDEVLNRFEELKEWHETGSSPIIREHEEDDRRRQQEIENRPPIGTETTVDDGRRTGCRVIYVDPARLQHDYENGKRGDINGSYSGDKISNPKSTVSRPFQFEHKRYVSTGSGDTPESAEAYQLVQLAEFKDEATTYADKLHHNPKDVDAEYPGDAARNDPMGFYHGMTVTSAGKPHVLAGPPVIFRPGKAGTSPARNLFRPIN